MSPSVCNVKGGLMGAGGGEVITNRDVFWVMECSGIRLWWWLYISLKTIELHTLNRWTV